MTMIPDHMDVDIIEGSPSSLAELYAGQKKFDQMLLDFFAHHGGLVEEEIKGILGSSLKRVMGLGQRYDDYLIDLKNTMGVHRFSLQDQQNLGELLESGRKWFA